MSICRLSLVLLLAASPAGARPPPIPDLDDYATDNIRPNISLGLLTAFAYHGPGTGADLFFGWPLLPNGFLSDARFRDALLADVGLNFESWAWGENGQDAELMLFAPAVGLRYAVYFWDYVAPMVNVHIGPAFARAKNTSSETRFFWHVSGGVLWDLTEFLALRLEFGWGSTKDMLRLGVVFWL